MLRPRDIRAWVILVALILPGCSSKSESDPQELYLQTVEVWQQDRGEQRRVLPRVAGIDVHLPCATGREGTDALFKGCSEPSFEGVHRRDWRDLERRVNHSLALTASAPALHARALLRILRSRTPAALDQAQNDLTKAIGLGEPSADLYNDLAVVRMLHASPEHPEFLLSALEAVLQAIEVEPTAEARFNRALLLSALHVHDRAVRVWQQVREEETQPDWRGEAEVALTRLAEVIPCERLEQDLASCLEAGCAIAAIDPQCREVVEDFVPNRLLPAWAADYLGGDEPLAEQRWRAAVRLQERLLALGLQADTSVAVRVVDEAAAAAARVEDLRTFARAVELYTQGRTALARNEPRSAEVYLRQARQQVAAGSALGFLIDYERARTLYRSHRDYRVMGDRFADLDRELPVQFGLLKGSVHRFMGLAEGGLGRQGVARENYRIAETYFTESKSALSLGYLMALLAESDFTLGRATEGWQHWLHGMSGTGARMRPAIAYNLVDCGVLALHEQGLDRAALELAEELVRLGDGLEDPNYRYQAHLRRGVILAALARDATALEDLALAKREVHRIPDPDLERRALADVRLVEAETLVRVRPREAIAHLDAILETYRQTEFNFFLPRLFSARGEAHRRLDQVAEARQDFAQAVEEVERVRRSLAASDLKVHFLDERRTIYERQLELELETGATPLESLLSADRIRLQRKPIDRTSWKPPIPEPSVCFVYYQVLPERLLIWFQFGEPELRRLAIDVQRTALRGMVESVLRELEWQEEEALARSSEALYDVLLRPTGACARDAAELHLAPDSFLSTVPFAVLRNADTGRLLIEDKTYRILPALAWLDEDEYSVDAKVAAAPSTQAPKGYPGLSLLKHVQHEAADVLANYPEGVLWNVEALSGHTLLERIAGVGLFHFAGHTLSDRTYPQRSALVLGPEDEDRLSASEIGQRDLRQVGLVFLSSCEALQGPESGSAGSLSLARAFLDAGAHAVIASVTKVDDELTAELSVAFHRHFAAGESASRALRLAQMELLRSTGGAHRAWAGYSLMGAEIRFGKSWPQVRLSSRHGNRTG